MQSDDIDLINRIQQGMLLLSQTATIPYRYNSRKLVYESDKIKLYHYKAIKKTAIKTPLLVVFATVNRPEILDLFPEKSFIGGLLQNGIDVYLLDWGYPDQNDSQIAFADYIAIYLKNCVDFITKKHKIRKISLLGICQGGVISLCYAALYKKIKNLILISAPIHFKTKENIVGALLRKVNFDDLIAVTGNVPGKWLTEFFIFMRPFELIGKKYLKFVSHLNDTDMTANFLTVEKWLHDAPDQPAKAFSEFVRKFYKENKLIAGKIEINGEKVNLKNLTMPILNVMAEQDEIVPMSASRALKKFAGTKDYTEILFPSGHIGIYVSTKVGKSMTDAIANWLKKKE